MVRGPISPPVYFSAMRVLPFVFFICISIIAIIVLSVQEKNSSLPLPAAVYTAGGYLLHHSHAIVELTVAIGVTGGAYAAYSKRRKQGNSSTSEQLGIQIKSGLEGNMLEGIPFTNSAKKIEDQFGKALAMLPEIKLKQIQRHKDFVGWCKTFGLDPQMTVAKISNEIIDMLHYVKPYFSSLLLQDINSTINERYVRNKVGKHYEFHLHSKDRFLKDIPTFSLNTLEAYIELIICGELERELSRTRLIFNMTAESTTESLEVHSTTEGIKTDLENLFIVLKMSLSRFFIFYSESGVEEVVGGQQDLDLELWKTEFSANDVSVLGLYSN
jgi:hypothetical protein